MIARLNENHPQYLKYCSIVFSAISCQALAGSTLEVRLPPGRQHSFVEI